MYTSKGLNRKDVHELDIYITRAVLNDNDWLGNLKINIG